MTRVLRRIVDRRQDFHVTDDYPHGWIEETLECGHVHIEAILLMSDVTVDGALRRHRHNAERRFCKECGDG